jgi:hypothetical protein
MDSMTNLILSVNAQIDQMSAEFKDPETTPARKEEIRRQLSQLYEELKKYVDK